jgi:hypothetical protein
MHSGFLLENGNRWRFQIAPVKYSVEIAGVKLRQEVISNPEQMTNRYRKCGSPIMRIC